SSLTTFAGKGEKKHKIKSATTLRTVYENGKPTTIKESFEVFDKNGNTIELTEFAKDGSVQRKETYSYDNNNNVTEEIIRDPRKNIDHKKTYRYSVIKDKTPLVEESEFNASGSLVKKTAYTYNASGKKASETVTDGSGVVISKQLFIYNARNLKTFRQTINKSNMLENVKEWQYEYY
ncbi:MAG: hypothetical protein WCL00_10090, partial [Bacteroidota bacterium]